MAITSRALLRPSLLRNSLVTKAPSLGVASRRWISLQQLDETKGDRERIVILGSGWAGYGLARLLDKKLFQPILVTPRTYFVFTPLLASTAVGTLEFRTAMESAHSIPGIAVIHASATSLQLPSTSSEPKTLTLTPATTTPASPTEPFTLSTTSLAIAVGCAPQTFSTPGVPTYTFFLRTPSDARQIRLRILSRFDAAALPSTTPERARELLHFAIVGGGPTGIEFAAELHDLIHDDLSRVYPTLKGVARITVYDVAPTILGMFDANLQSYARSVFKRQGIEVRTEHHVERVEEDAIVTKEDGRVKVGAVIWSTGLDANPFVSDVLPEQVIRERHGSTIKVDGHLRVLTKHDGMVEEEALDGVYALGDCAAVSTTKGLPATAQVADQQAKYLAKTLNRAAATRKTNPQTIAAFDHPVSTSDEKQFSFKSLGIMAYLGGWRAITQSGSGKVDLKGRMSWVLWRTAYLSKSVSWRNRVMIPVYWAVTWFLGRDVNRF